MRFIKKRLVNLIMRNLYKAVVVDDVIKVSGNKIYKGNKVLEGRQAYGLKKDAELILELELWKYMQDKMRYVANQRMFNQSKNFDDMMFGKAVLYVADVYDNILKNLKNLK